ncbi:putative sulfate transporter 3.5 [Camellia lanceoleosa]|uniref:Sulfate transporter 3.5 n=1 Tax=Camellia lanceoleosa TaxID=1840588 RepID=A0ACC0IB11_9ERIC|nr:putative sulfate transporter 3.5 [Camellia lanceoleosa]
MVGLAILRALLYVARRATCKLGSISNSTLYRVPGILVLQLGSPIYFSNYTYIRERILRWVRDEQAATNSKGMILSMFWVTSIDIIGVETLIEVFKSMEARRIKVGFVNPRLEVLEKFTVTKFIEIIGKKNVFLLIEDTVETCTFTLRSSKQFDDA